MTKRQSFTILCVLAVMLAIASIGTWESGPLGYTGISTEGGILTAVAAAAVVLVSWWWFASQRQLALVAALAAGTMCIGIAIYSIIDIRDFYLNAGDVWVERIGWGLVLTLVASLTLVLLSSLLLWGARSGEAKPARWLIMGLLCTVCLLAVVLWIAGAGDSEPSGPEPRLANEGKSPIPAYALKASGGSVDGIAWGIWLFGQERDNCWATKSGEHFAYEEVRCGFNVPPKTWQLAAEGQVDDRGKVGESLLFFLTRRDVGYLSVLTGRSRPRGTGATWTQVRLRSVGKDQARRARLIGKLRYGAVRVPNPACVRKVNVFDRVGMLVKATKLFPCRVSMPSSPLEL